MKQYTAGVDQLNENSDALKSGASSLESGAKALSEGINTLSSGATKYVSGADTLADGTTAYVKGAQELADGAKQLSALESLGDVSDGIAQLNTGVQKELKILSLWYPELQLWKQEPKNLTTLFLL